jgi:hypothetical protein
MDKKLHYIINCLLNQSHNKYSQDIIYIKIMNKVNCIFSLIPYNLRNDSRAGVVHVQTDAMIGTKNASNDHLTYNSWLDHDSMRSH